jgi:spermidine synthase
MRRPKPAPLLLLFFLSGAAGLAYQLVFTKLLGTVFGTTAYATATVLAAFMAGLALGSALVSRVADRVRRPLRLYALIELGIGAYMLAVPLLMHAVQAGYVGLNRATPLSLAELNLIRFVLGGAVILLPTALMGATLPLLARHLVLRGQGGGPGVARLYAVNTFGAAAGTLAANYLFLPWSGLYGAIGAGVLANLWVGLRALRLDRAGAGGAASAVPAEASPRENQAVAAHDRILLLAALATGLLAFVYEVVWTHLLAVVVGTSAYAFGDMLFALLFGMAAGSLWIARHPASPALQLARLARCQLGVGIAVVLTIPLWDHLPLVFKLAGYTLPGFFARELVRIVASFAVLAVPAALMGVSFPLLIESLGGGDRRLGRRVGSAYALNTFGAIAGATLTGFLILPAWGSRTTLLAAAGMSILLGAGLLRLPGAALHHARLRWLAGAAAVLLLGLVWPAWNYKVLLSGYNVTFVSAGRYQRILYVHEDVHGGVTSVSERADGDLELRTNGKFQGTARNEMQVQRGFALIPALLAPRYDRAAVIGLGTGMTAGTLARFPFRHIDIAELAPGIVEAARRYFAAANDRVLDDPRVRLVLEDGRNMLLLNQGARYDLITVELTSIWFAGAASLYSLQFFELVRDRLAPGGVFQQWIQLHHIDPLDVLRILNTMRRVFPHVTLWRIGNQGMIVASMETLRARYDSVMRVAGPEAMGRTLDFLPLAHPLALFGDQLLQEAEVDSAIGFVSRRVGPGLTRSLFISSDMLPWLEYSTPRANANAVEFGAAVKFFENYSGGRAPPIEGIPNQTERDFIYGLVALRKGDLGNALRLLEPVAAARPADRRLAELLSDLRRRLTERPL